MDTNGVEQQESVSGIHAQADGAPRRAVAQPSTGPAAAPASPPPVAVGSPHSTPPDPAAASKQPELSKQASSSMPGPKVVLRQEVATKVQARILTWSVIVLNILFVVLAAVLFGVHSKPSVTASEVHSLYWLRLGITIACEAALLFTGAWFFFAVRRCQKEGRVWSKRQWYFGWTAGGLWSLQLAYSSCILASLSSTLAQADCHYPWKALAVLQFFQWSLFSGALFFLLARLKNMQLWRGPGALDMHPDHRLVMDRPIQDQAASHFYILLIWMALEAAALAGMIIKLQKIGNAGPRLSAFNCETDLKQITCTSSSGQTVTNVIGFVVIVLMGVAWVVIGKRAQRDHELLPFFHYRDTHIYVRVQRRVLTPVFTAVTVSLLFMTIIPSFQGNCVAAADSQVGNVSVLLSMTVAALVMVILYMPKAAGLDSPLRQAFLQEFSWTQADVAGDLEARNQRLRASEDADLAAKAQGLQGKGMVAAAGTVVTDVITFLPGAAMAGMAKMAHVQDMSGALAQLAKEPIFCIETAVRLFYWTRLAYRKEDSLDSELLNATTALRLFDLDQHVTVWDDKTDTHAVLGWSTSRVVLAFRSSGPNRTNAMTDLKAWKTVLQPVRRVRGIVVKAHAGFANAWLNNEFNLKVLAKLKEIDAERPAGAPPLRIWITGHSLGGALAILASVEVRSAFPDSQMTCYTWGAPRVGNSAFTAEQEEAVPDTWAILNGMDPIPWIPKGSFKRAGKRVTINPKGDLILRPSYFEVSVLQRGTVTKHHMTTSYARSLATIFKAQFVASKAFPGGAEGVRRLAAAVDIGEALVLKQVDLDSLANPDVLPIPAELAGSQKALDRRHSMLDDCGAACCGSSTLGGWWLRSGQQGKGLATSSDDEDGEGEGEVVKAAAPAGQVQSV